MLRPFFLTSLLLSAVCSIAAPAFAANPMVKMHLEEANAFEAAKALGKAADVEVEWAECRSRVAGTINASVASLLSQPNRSVRHSLMPPRSPKSATNRHSYNSRRRVVSCH